MFFGSPQGFVVAPALFSPLWVAEECDIVVWRCDILDGFILLYGDILECIHNR